MSIERFYTIQHVNAWREAQAAGILTGNPAFIDPHFIRPYQWIRKQMQARQLMDPHHNGFPVWAWIHAPQPELYTIPGMLIEFNADPENALITRFDEWHILLNANEMEHQNEETHLSESDIFKWKEIIVPATSLTMCDDQLLQFCFDKIQLQQVINVTML
jgi:hypothetical protein